MKHITYLFMVYKNAEFVRHTVERLACVNASFYVHVDSQSVEDFHSLELIDGVCFSDKRFHCKWGDAGIVYAISYCLKRIVEIGKADYIVLMSESDYPVKSSDYIQQFFNRIDKDFATAHELPCDNPLGAPDGYWIEGGMRRVNAYAVRFGKKGVATIEPGVINWGNIRQFGKLILKDPFKLIDAVACLFKPERICPVGITWCGGDLWFTLRMKTVKKIVNYLDSNSDILREAEVSDCLDEVVIPSLIYAFSDKSERENNILRFVNWPRGKCDSPADLTISDKELIRKQVLCTDILFIRKVQDMNVAIMIDDMVSNESVIEG